jgi:hypothetical protein
LTGGLFGADLPAAAAAAGSSRRLEEESSRYSTLINQSESKYKYPEGESNKKKKHDKIFQIFLKF